MVVPNIFGVLKNITYHKLLNNRMNDYINLISSWPKKWRTRKIQQHTEIVDFLNNKFPNVSLPIQIHCLLTNTSPYCVVCNKPVKSQRKKTCSIQCRSANTDQNKRILQQKKTLIERYGVDNIRNIEGADEKRKETMKKKYSALVSPVTRQKAKERVTSLNHKGKQTLFENHKVYNPGQMHNHREKCKKTLLQNYKADNYFKSDTFKDITKTRLKVKYDTFCPNTIQIQDILEPTNKNEYQNPNKLVSFTCLSCNNRESIPSETFKWRIQNTGTSCQKCSGINKGSSQEQEIKYFLEQELKLDIQCNKRILPNNKEIDILIPKFNLGIEYNGLFWHNDLRISKQYHREKQEQAKNIGITLLHIFEDEWLHNKEITKSRIRNYVKLCPNKIFARKCVVKKITTELERDFLKNNHIQGYAKSSVKLGLFYKDQLVSLMTFSKPNKSKGQKKEENFWELLRFCSVINTNVVGGASKLFAFFVKNYTPNKVLSFADNRWSKNGDVYRKLNFKFVKQTSVNYWYVNLKDMKRIHRFSMRKNIDDDKNLTEYQNRLNQGFLRIWDCGSSKYIWNKK